MINILNNYILSTISILLRFLFSSSFIPQGKHIMFSYHINDQHIVEQIRATFAEISIPVWLTRNQTDENIHDEYIYSNKSYFILFEYFFQIKKWNK